VPLAVPVRACVYTTTAPGRTSHALGTIEQYKRMRARAAELLDTGRMGR
jgi:hypothetical protein